MKHFLIVALSWVWYSLLSITVSGQTIVDGPTCVLAGVEYQYNIKGNISDGAQLCVTGGQITGSASACTSDLKLGYVRVVWSGKTGSIAFTSTEGNSSNTINVTSPLQSGIVSNTGKQQFISYNASPVLISCDMPTGGSCGFSYSFQWQQSLDDLNWQDIKGATGQNLTSVSPLKLTTFFRRRTIETTSGTITYSASAAIYVAPDTAGH